jgi:hypothetical protein
MAFTFNYSFNFLFERTKVIKMFENTDNIQRAKCCFLIDLLFEIQIFDF